jgi:hypothetical protein
MAQSVNNRRSIFTIFLIAFCPIIYAQKVVTHLEAKNLVEDIQCYKYGSDSLLITYVEQIPETTDYTRSAFWIHNNQADTITLDLLNNHFLSGTTYSNGKQYYYYIDEKNKERKLMAFTGAPKDSVIEVLPKEKLTGDLLGVINEQQLFVVTYNPSGEKLTVNIIEGKDPISTLTYQMPFDISFYYGSSYSIFNSWLLPNTAGGSAEFKLYKTNRAINITIDKPKFGKSSRTEIISLPLVEGAKPSVRYIKGPKRVNFRSFLMGDTLYRAVATRKNIDFTFYNVTSGNLTGSLRIGANDKKAQEFITTRLGHLSIIHREETLAAFMQASGNFFPSVFAFDNIYRPEVAIGSFILSDNTGSGSAGFGLGRMIAYQHPTAITIAREPEGVSKYFHLLQRQSGFQFEDAENRRSVMDRIDDYELSQVSLYQTQFGSKSYINLEDRVVAVYYLPAAKKIAVMSFSK